MLMKKVAIVLGCISGASTTLHAGTGALSQVHSLCPEDRSNLQIVQSSFARWSAGGNVFEGLLAEDVVWTIHGSGSVAGTYNGLRDFTQRAALPLTSRLATPLVPKVHFMISDCDRVIIRFGAAATKTSGNFYRNEFVWILRMAAGQVVEAEAFLDLAAYQRVIETSEPHPGR